MANIFLVSFFFLFLFLFFVFVLVSSKFLFLLSCKFQFEEEKLGTSKPTKENSCFLEQYLCIQCTFCSNFPHHFHLSFSYFLFYIFSFTLLIFSFSSLNHFFIIIIIFRCICLTCAFVVCFWLLVTHVVSVFIDMWLFIFLYLLYLLYVFYVFWYFVVKTLDMLSCIKSKPFVVCHVLQ